MTDLAQRYAEVGPQRLNPHRIKERALLTTGKKYLAYSHMDRPPTSTSPILEKATNYRTALSIVVTTTDGKRVGRRKQ